MGLFTTQRAHDRLEDRLRTLEVKCDDLERSRRNLDLEFTELYDKVRHQMSRMAKRDARAAKLNGSPSEDSSSEESSDGIDPISRSIMMRRARQVTSE